MKDKIINRVQKSVLFHQFIELLKTVKFKRYENLTLYEVVKVFIDKVTKDDVMERANGVAFNFTLSIFPAVIFLFTLIPYIHEWVPEVSKSGILDFLQDLMPASMYATVESTLQDILGNTRGGLLTFGAIFSLYLATNGMMSLMKAFNSVYKTTEKRSYIKMRLVATALTVMLAVALILASILLVAGNIALGLINEISWLDIEAYQVYIFFFIRFLILYIIFFLCISFIYYFGPAVHYNWRFFSVGSIIATTFCILFTYGFSFYISNFGTYNKLYGSLGVLIALMIWQEVLSIVLLVGYEINASIHQAYRLIGVKERSNI